VPCTPTGSGCWLALIPGGRLLPYHSSGAPKPGKPGAKATVSNDKRVAGSRRPPVTVNAGGARARG